MPRLGPGRRIAGAQVGLRVNLIRSILEKNMRSHEDNERLVSVGKGTPLGESFRLYWIPFLPSADLARDGESGQR